MRLGYGDPVCADVGATEAADQAARGNRPIRLAAVHQRARDE
jgi:hypothetical protein